MTDLLTKNVTTAIAINDLVDLYDSVEWSAYTRGPAQLKKSIDNSSYVLSLCKTSWCGRPINVAAMGGNWLRRVLSATSMCGRWFY